MQGENIKHSCVPASQHCCNVFMTQVLFSRPCLPGHVKCQRGGGLSKPTGLLHRGISKGRPPSGRAHTASFIALVRWLCYLSMPVSWPVGGPATKKWASKAAAHRPVSSKDRYEPDSTHRGGPLMSGTPTLTSPSVSSESCAAV